MTDGWCLFAFIVASCSGSYENFASANSCCRHYPLDVRWTSRPETSGQINIPCSTGYRLHPMQPRFRYVTRYQSCPRNRNSTLSPIRALPKRHFIQEIGMDYRQAYGGAKPKRLPRSRLSVPYPPLRPVYSMLHAIVTIFSIRLAQFVSIVRRTISKDLFSEVRYDYSESSFLTSRHVWKIWNYRYTLYCLIDKRVYTIREMIRATINLNRSY